MPYLIDLHHDGRTTARLRTDGGQPGRYSEFHIAHGDTRPALEATLLDPTGEPVDLDGADVSLELWPRGTDRSDRTTVSRSGVEIVDAEAGHVRYEWATRDTSGSRPKNAAFDVKLADGGRQTIPNGRPITIIIE